MKSPLLLAGLALAVHVAFFSNSSAAQDEPVLPSNGNPATGAAPVDEVLPPGSAASEGTTPTNNTDSATDETSPIMDHTKEAVSELAEKINQDERAHEAAAGILKPIYQLAEYMEFSTFHWVAFMLMVAGTISFALQLVLGKLMVLTRLGLSLKEILSDAIGLIISLIGLMLTTQAATQNSAFTQSPAAVLSAAVVGVVLGFILYVWGQSQEIEAAAGRSAAIDKT